MMNKPAAKVSPAQTRHTIPVTPFPLHHPRTCRACAPREFRARFSYFPKKNNIVVILWNSSTHLLGDLR